MNNDTIELLQQGELELRKVFEETTTKNVRTIVAYTTETRKMFRELEERMHGYEAKISQQAQQIQQLQQQIAQIRGQLYRPGD